MGTMLVEVVIGAAVGGFLMVGVLFSSMFTNLVLALIGGSIVLIQADGGVAKVLAVAKALFADALAHPGFLFGLIAGAIAIAVAFTINRD